MDYSAVYGCHIFGTQEPADTGCPLGIEPTEKIDAMAGDWMQGNRASKFFQFQNSKNPIIVNISSKIP